MTTALFLIAMGAAWRLVYAFHWLDLPNFVPLTALTVFAAMKLPRRWACFIPMAILVLPDLIIDLQHGYPFFAASRFTGYATFVLIALMATYAPARMSVPARVLATVAGSTLFFLVSNFAVWAGGEGLSRPATIPGLLACYNDAIPFYRNMLVADLIGAIVLLGVDALLVRTPEVTPLEQRVTE